MVTNRVIVKGKSNVAEKHYEFERICIHHLSKTLVRKSNNT